MEYINIISKEEIMQAFQPPIIIVGCLAIAAALSTFIYWGIGKDIDKVMKYLYIAGSVGIICLIATIVICATFFRVPTGRYKYEATIDKDRITVSQYEEFIEEYNPIIKDGVYYWED